MDFKIEYYKLIEYRKQHILQKNKKECGMIESHHILPRCCGGTDDPENLVNLYAKEHFMAHYYLWKMHENDEFKYQLLCAFWNMCTVSSSSQKRTYQEFVKMSEEYQQARIEFAKYASEIMPDKVKGEKNGAYGKHWYYDPITKQSNSFYEGQEPKGWIRGRYISEDTKQRLSNIAKNTCWICTLDESKQKHLDKDTAKILVDSGKWKYGHKKLSDKEKNEQRKKSLLTKIEHGSASNKVLDDDYIPKNRYPICLNCGKPNPNKFAICCCSSCKNEYHQKKEKEKLEEKRRLEVNEIEKQQQFRAQITELYKGVIDRKQVRRYLEFKGNHSCNCCGKENVKLIVHAIDGNCRNLSINNYEFLCHECYINSGTNGFSGHSMKEINKQRKLKNK